MMRNLGINTNDITVIKITTTMAGQVVRRRKKCKSQNHLVSGTVVPVTNHSQDTSHLYSTLYLCMCRR